MSNAKRRHHVGTVPPTADEALFSALLRLTGNCGADAFDLHEYGKLERPQAVSGPGLFKMRQLLGVIMSVQPGGRIKLVQLREQILAVVAARPSVRFNKSSYPNHVWANYVSRKVGVALAHWRQACTSYERFDRACRKLEPDQRSALEHMQSVFSPSEGPPHPKNNSKSFEAPAVMCFCSQPGFHGCAKDWAIGVLSIFLGVLRVGAPGL